MEEIFEPRPSTSSEDIQLSRDSLIRTGARDSQTPDPGTGPRKLSIIPRTSQYERHPLLQERSASGLSQLEELTNLLQKQKSFDLGDGDSKIAEVSQNSKSATSPLVLEPESPHHQGSEGVIHHSDNTDAGLHRPHLDKNGSNNNSVHVTHPKIHRLEPRGAICERHPLLEKSESGMSELEMYLIEKEQEFLLQSTRSDSIKNNFRAANEVEKASTQPSIPCPLQPRLNQYEKHALLESRDEQGLSPLDHFFNEKQQIVIERLVADVAELDDEEDSTGSKGKCSEKCVCKNASCTICKPNNPNSPLVNHSQKDKLSSTGKETSDQSLQDYEELQNIPADNRANVFMTENNEEVIDLRKNKAESDVVQEHTMDGANAIQEDGLQHQNGDNNTNNEEHGEYDEEMRAHPTLMKKESSRETMIEPKETNKRVHFERTLSEKEREMRRVNDPNSPAQEQDKCQTAANNEAGNGKKRRFWSLFGGRRACQKDLSDAEPSPDNENGKTNETVPLVDRENEQLKDKNENNKKTHRKHCVIL